MYVLMEWTSDHVESPHEDDVVEHNVDGADVCTDGVGRGVVGSGIVVQIVIVVGIFVVCVCEDVVTKWSVDPCDDEREHVLMVCEDKSNGRDGVRIVGAEVKMDVCGSDDMVIGVYFTLTSGSMMACIEN